MAKLQQLKDNGNSIYPVTHMTGVLDDRGKNVGQYINDLESSVNPIVKEVNDAKGNESTLKNRFDVIDNQLENMVTEYTEESIQIEFPGIHNKVEELCNGYKELSTKLDAIENENSKKIEYLTPKMFGAKGDGITDDTDALREAIYQSHITGKMLIFPNNCKCLVSAPLNYYNNEYYNVTLNIRGVLPTAKWEYSLSNSGGISVKNETNLFFNKTIKGEISNISFTGIRNENLHFFDSCHLEAMYIHGCNITNFGAFLFDSGMSGVSRIDRNTFLTVFYFHRYDSKDKEITDSFITNNYINGGQEPVDNACFEFRNGNGSIIQGNFIDYYKTIYRPKPQATVELPTSIGNQYQVFLYLYEITHGGTFKFSSVGDTFNWTDDTKLAKLKTYTKSTYTGKDGNKYEMPTYIAMSKSSSSVSMKNAYIQSNVGNIVFIYNHIGEYELGEFDINFVGVSKYRSQSVKLREGDSLPYYINGAYDYNTTNPWFIEKVGSLPSINTPWSKYPLGYRVRYNSQNYKFIKKVDKETNTRKPQWVEIDEG